MSDTGEYNLVIAAFEGKETADYVYNTLLDMQNANMITVKTMSTVYLNDRGKLKVHHKHGLTTWKGAAGGLAVGLLLGGPFLGGAVGAMVGSRGDGEQRKAKEFLDEKLGADDSAIIVAFKDADLEAVRDMFIRYDAERLMLDLTPEVEEELAKLTADEEIARSVHEDVEIVNESR
jgi:uncharacterized membrane protein